MLLSKTVKIFRKVLKMVIELGQGALVSIEPLHTRRTSGILICVSVCVRPNTYFLWPYSIMQ
jgi:hypothetical protein